MIAIFYALKNEINKFKRHLNIIRQQTIQNATFCEGEVDKIPVLLAQTGIGIKNAELAVKTAVERFKIDLIISTGFAGALRDEIDVGDIVCAKNILYSKNLQEIKDQKLVTNIKRQCQQDYVEPIKGICGQLNIPFYFGDIITVDKVISTSSKKKWLGDNSTAIAVDMETAAIAETAANRNIKFISVRSVSDDVKSDLHIMEDINDILEGGRVDLKKLGWKFAKNVQNIPHLIKLRKQTIIASHNIARLMLNLIKDLLKSDLFSLA